MNISISTIVNYNTYHLVLEEKNNRLLHLHHIHSLDDRMETVTPVFQSLYQATRFKTEIIERFNFNTWYASKYTFTNEVILQTKLDYFYKNDYVDIETDYFENNENSIKSMMHNLTLFYVEDFWLKQKNNHLVVTGNLWETPRCLSGESCDVEFVKESYEDLYLGF